MFELADRSLARDIMEQFGRLDLSACYCSVFDACWATSYSTFGAPTALKNPVFENKIHEEHEKDSNKRQDNP